MRHRTKYNDAVELLCLENGQVLKAEILDYSPAYMMVVSVDRKIKISMRYNTGKKLYIGNVGSLEFTSQGPKG